MKKIIQILVLFILINLNISFAENDIKEINNIKETNLFLKDKKINNNLNILNTFKIDLTELKDKLSKENDSKILFEWNIPGEKTINGAIFEKKFKTSGEKEINLNIYKIIKNNKELINNNKINIFVYKTKILSIFEKSELQKIKDFILKAKESGIYIDKVLLHDNEIEKYNFSKNIINKLNKNNYLLIWGTKDFMFNILSKINTENINKKINIVGISGFNINLLKKFIQNFITNKNWINKALLLDESSKYEIIKQANDINKLEQDLITNNYEFINLNNKSKINNILFISKFINNLSNLGFSTKNIYIILIIPFLLLGISIFKHIVGLTPTGILIPVSITILFLKIGIIPTLIIIIIFFLTNLLLSKIISKYNMHYTPKIVMLTIINILVLIILINIFIEYNIISITINDIIFIILFILISEKLINIMVSKEFGEYKNSLTNTLIFSVIALLIFKVNFIKTFILAYPEIILILIPIAFFIGKFTGLRVSEYFRFKEVIKSIEE